MMDLDREAGDFIDRVGIDLTQPFTREQLADLLASFAGKIIAETSKENEPRTDR